MRNHSGEAQDHLFISYASEDAVLAQWLTLKLAAAGYRVWCDRINLLGGESYPRDINDALESRTFRVLALLSRHSILKPNPLKERTKALNLGRARGIDFLIPLNADGLTPPELDWMTSDLSWIPFDKSWAVGYRQLIKKLENLRAPKTMAYGREAVVRWYEQEPAVKTEPERLWTNLVELRVPPTLKRLQMQFPLAASLPEDWPHRWEGTSTIWAFEFPDLGPEWSGTYLTEFNWREQPVHIKLRLADVAVDLAHQYINRHCRSRGLVQSDDGDYMYFGEGIVPGERLNFVSYTEKSSFIQATGKRSFRTSTGTETAIYHLAPSLRPNFWSWPDPVVEIQMRVYLTDLGGQPLDPHKALRRRKRIVRDWYNHQWLTRLLATMTWLAAGEARIRLAIRDDVQFWMGARVRQTWAPIGIDESSLTPVEEDEPPELDDVDEFGLEADGGN
jgi:hypothetical protein